MELSQKKKTTTVEEGAAKKAAPKPTLETSTSPAPAKEKLSEKAVPAKTPAEIEAKLRAELEQEYADKYAKQAGEKKVTEKPANQEDIADAIRKSSAANGANEVDRVIIIRAKNVASSGEVQLGQLLPGIKRGYHVYKNEFGAYVTGLTDDELKRLNKVLPVWDVDRNIPNEEYWKSYVLSLGTSEKRLRVDKAERHFIDWKVALSHPDIANTESDMTSRTPFFIVDEEAEANKSNKELDALTASYNALSEMSPQEKRSFLSLFGVSTKDSSDSVITLHLRQQAEEAPLKFVAMFKDTSKAEKITLSEMVEFGVLRKASGAYYFNESLIAVDLLSAVQWMSDPTNQDVKLLLLQELEVTKHRR